MILIGMYDSPFTRRVAIALALLGYRFEHRAWSVGADFDRIREYSPLGRVPVLVLDDGAVLTESAAILDWLEREPGGETLLPAGGAQRREAMRLIGLASGAADRCVAGVLERIRRGGQARLGEAHRLDAVGCGAPRMQRLRHAAEVGGQARCEAGSNGKRVARVLLVEPAQVRTRSGGGHGPEHPGRMPALAVMRVCLAPDQLRPVHISARAHQFGNVAYPGQAGPGVLSPMR